MSTINPDRPLVHDPLLNTNAVAAWLGITPRQVSRARQAGALKCVRISGSAVRHTRAQVEAFIASRSNDA